MDVNTLIDACDAFGLPTILVQHHGFLLKVEPDDVSNQGGNTVFLLDGEPVCHVSRLDDIALLRKRRPDNYIVECEICYSLLQAETGERICEMFWPKK